MKINVKDYPKYLRRDWEYFIEQCIIGNNAERNRKITALALLDGWTYFKIAEKFDLTERQVSSIITDCCAMINSHI